jgi:hypothetical protein
MKVYKNIRREIDIHASVSGFFLEQWDPCSDEKSYGYSMYKGIFMKWGSKDINTTILDLLDSLDIYTHERLFSICNCNGVWSFYWRGFVPNNWKGRRVVEAYNGDICIWKVQQSQDNQYYYTEERLKDIQTR